MLGVKAIEGEILPAGDWDPDTERLFSEFRDSFAKDETGGTVYVSKIPLDDRGNPMGNSKGQARLFEAPIGSLSLDDICNRVKREYMRRGELRICVRIIGIKHGEQGVRYNRIVVIEAPNETEPEKASGLGGDLASVLAAFQRSSDAAAQRTEMMMARIIDAQTRQPVAPMQSFNPMEMMQGVIGMMAVAQKMFVAPAGGVAGAAPMDALSQLERLASAAPRIGRMFGGGDNGGRTDMGSVIAAVAPAATEFFKAFNKERADGPPPVRRQIARRPEPPLTPIQEVERDVKQTVAEATSISDTPQETAQVPPATMEAIKEIVSGLIEAAQNDPERKNCEQAAKELLAEVPDEMDEQIFDLVSSPTGFKMKLGFVDPRTALYHEWFEELRKHVKGAYDVGAGDGAAV